MIGNIDVVPMSLEHIDDIMVVEHLSFKIPWSRDAFIEEVTRNSFAIYFAAKIQGKVIGYAGMWKVCDEGHITNIAVHPEFRSSGVGSHLLESLIAVAKEKEISGLTLEVRRSNSAAQGLYMKYGFEVSGIRKAYYADNGEDAIIMWKNQI